MEIENFNNLKSNPVGKIDLDNLEPIFYDEKSIIEIANKYHLDNFSDFDKWLKNNLESLEGQSEKIDKLVQAGKIRDDNYESVFEYVKNSERSKVDINKIIKLIELIKLDIDNIKKEAASVLSKFLPDWKMGKWDLIFTLNKRADFYIDGGKITIDLERLSFTENFREELLGGIVHESFHAWMEENMSPEMEIEKNELKSDIIRGIVNEGLAVLIAGQSLRKHHEKKGRDYEKYRNESLSMFSGILGEIKYEELKKIAENDFKDMGRCYVAGYEICRAVLDKLGIENFREIIKNCPNNSMKMIEEYEKINN